METPVERIRLRLHWGGHLEQEPAPAGAVEFKPSWRYIGGEMFNESVPMSFRYADLCLKLNEKVGYTTSIKYQAPGEDLSPNELVSITGDDDLQELYDEYFQALRRPGTPIKTFRVKVFLFPALQDELDIDAEASARAVEFAALADRLPRSQIHDGFDPNEWVAPDGIGEFSEPIAYPAGVAADDLDDSEWCGDDGDIDNSTELSCAPSEMQWAPQARPPELAAEEHTGFEYDAELAMDGVGDRDGDAYSEQELPPGVMPAFSSAAIQRAGAPLFADGVGSPIDRAAIHNLLASVSMVQPRARGITEEIGLMDPYHEGDDSPPARIGMGGIKRPGVVQRAAAVGGIHEQWAGRAPRPSGFPVCEHPTHLWDMAPHMSGVHRAHGDAVAHVHNNGCSPGSDAGGAQREQPRGSLPGHLPSHISVFGSDGGRYSQAGPEEGADSLPHGAGASHAGVSGRGTGFLPSHISIFGDCVSGKHGSSIGDAGTALTAGYRGAGGGMCTPPGHHGSKVITQEFASPRTSPRALQLGTGMRGGADDELLGPDATGADGEERLPAGLDLTPLASTPKLLDEVVKVPVSEVHIIRKIGEGAFGEVSYASVQSHGLVAIKWLKRDRFTKYSESFMREAEVLAKLNHPNIIRMYGVIVEPTARSSAVSRGAHESGSSASSSLHVGPQNEEMSIAGIMTDYVRGGSLSGQLRAAKRRPTLRERCMVAVQAARGMAFLHAQTPAVIHFDLKPDNLLVDGDSESLHVKVADFGLSKHKFQNFVSCRDLRGTLPYMAPELVSNPNQVSEKCDVWSMGVVMWEMYTLEVPYRDMSAQQILLALMQGSIHLRIPSGCEPEWRGLIEMCMDPDPTARPSFKQLTSHLDALQRQLWVEG
mmetsp:Transcript_25426/g.75108  ORF Transcript_25426/g.75108 Transcript_25426/m.75108 type:complete len:878 (-) Transcript_25426:269-2902(-)